MLTPKLLRSFNNLLPNCPDEAKSQLLNHVKNKRIVEKGLDPKIVILRLAAAYVRHHYTEYDKVVHKLGKEKARMKVVKEVEQVMKKWRTRESNPTLAWEIYKNNFSGKVFDHKNNP